MFELTPVPASEWTYRQIEPPGTKMITLEKNDRIIRHLSFDIEGKDFSYLLGDALNIFPQNDPDRVRRFLEFYGVDPDEVYHVRPAQNDIDKRRRSAYQRPLTVQQ